MTGSTPDPRERLANALLMIDAAGRDDFISVQHEVIQAARALLAEDAQPRQPRVGDRVRSGTVEGTVRSVNATVLWKGQHGPFTASAPLDALTVLAPAGEQGDGQ